VNRFDLQGLQGAAKLGQPGFFSIHPKDTVAVAVQGHRTAMQLQIGAQRGHIGLGGLGRNKTQVHERAGGIIDKHQQRTGRRTALKPVVR
jgi:hypothetical protein